AAEENVRAALADATSTAGAATTGAAACELRVVDVDRPENKDWWRRYNYDVPVLHINGRPAFKHAVSRESLAALLKELL
ncbi:hypothetical protein HK405_006250, partial [Cladochytrium tenue]